MNEVLVRLGARSYSVEIEEGLIDRIGDRLLAHFRDAPRVIVAADRRVFALHGRRLVRALQACRMEPVVLTVPSGEGQKTLARAQDLHGRMLRAGADRRTPLIAFGGGVIGDLGGFVAATYMRGIPFVQVPTTFLAQVDASVGGKVAVNHPQAKNLIGCFHQPKAVYADPGLLSTLPRRELCAGLAECVKIGVIRNADFFQFLERNADAILRRDPFAFTETIATAVSLKADIVERDERDARLRMLLNYGHTLGHALEAATRYRRWRHGEAIAVGMTLAGRIAARRGRMTAAQLRRQTDLLERFELPVRCGTEAAALLRYARGDKKNRGGALTFVLPRGIGSGTVVAGVEEEEVREAVRWARAESAPARRRHDTKP